MYRSPFVIIGIKNMFENMVASDLADAWEVLKHVAID